MNRKHFTAQFSEPAQGKLSFPPLKAERSQKMVGYWVESLEKSCFSSGAKLARKSRLLWSHHSNAYKRALKGLN